MSAWLFVYLILGLMALAAVGIVVALVAIGVTVSRRRVRDQKPGQ